MTKMCTVLKKRVIKSSSGRSSKRLRTETFAAASTAAFLSTVFLGYHVYMTALLNIFNTKSISTNK